MHPRKPSFWLASVNMKYQTSRTGLQLMTAGLSLAPAVSRGPAAGQSISPVLLDNNINISHIFWPKFPANFPICVWRWTDSPARSTGSFIQAENIRDTAAGFWFTAEKCLLLLHINNQINCGSSAGGRWRKQYTVESRQVDVFSVLWECLQLSMSRSSGISSDISPTFFPLSGCGASCPVPVVRKLYEGIVSGVSCHTFIIFHDTTWYLIPNLVGRV